MIGGGAGASLLQLLIELVKECLRELTEAAVGNIVVQPYND